MEILLKKLIKQKISLSIKNGNIKVSFDGESLPAELIEEIKSNKTALISYLEKKKLRGP